MNKSERDAWLPVAIRRIGMRRVRLRDCLVDIDLDRIVAPHGETALEPKVMAVLTHLIEHAGAVVSADELIETVWRGRPMGDNPVYRSITQLRRALGDDPRASRFIATVPTKGYRLVAPVEPLEPERPPPAAVNPARERPPWTASFRRRAVAGALVLIVLLTSSAIWLWQRSPQAGSEFAAPAAITLAVLPAHSVARDEDASEAAINLDAYRVYLRGSRILLAADSSTVNEARELFRRATILDPGFARGYLGLGLAYLKQAEDDPGPAVEARRLAARAFDRALQLDPALGEAWIGRARNEPDTERAESFFRKGLALAPGDADGYERYATFLFHTARVGEAIDVVQRARQLQPQAPGLYLLQAFMVMVMRSDVAEHDHLVRQALAIDPQSTAAMQQLAYSCWEYSGQFAQAARIIEREIAIDPQSFGARMLARDIHLDLRDPAAATAVLGASPAPVSMIEIAQYRGDHKGAAAVLRTIAADAWPDAGPQASKAQALRDAAIDSGELVSAAHLLGAVQAARAGRLPMAYRGFTLVYAHTLVLAGKQREGQQLARAMLAQLDAHGAGRRKNWFCRERASAFAILGDDTHVLEELAHCIDSGQIYRWWYLAEHDPLYAHLRGNPAFQALDRLARAHLERQRVLLASMRPAGEVGS